MPIQDLISWFDIALATLFTVYDVDLLILLILAISAGIYNRRKVNKVEQSRRGSLAELRQASVAGGSVNIEEDEAGALKLEVHSDLPKVLIQIPLYNEEAHCELIIQRCLALDYPKSRMLIQVLDDSTKQHIVDRLVKCVGDYKMQGLPVELVRRDNRQGFKAGALTEGLRVVKEEGYKYAAIFDADFEPPVDFLRKTVPVLEKDEKVGFVQTRWTFANVNSLLTWAQKVNLDFHFCVEQQGRSFFGAFFNFNGTAGVWRIECIENSGVGNRILSLKTWICLSELI
jgi:cellulose synthase/poly-beta-1,6-N-acetylglucosamine synthase-like glycosyltransferase